MKKNHKETHKVNNFKTGSQPKSKRKSPFRADHDRCRAFFIFTTRKCETPISLAKMERA